MENAVDNYRLGDDIQSKVLAFAFGLSAEIERNLISQRTKEDLAGVCLFEYFRKTFVFLRTSQKRLIFATEKEQNVEIIFNEEYFREMYN